MASAAGASRSAEREKVTLRAISFDEEGRKRVSKLEVEAHDPDTLRHIEKKLVAKGLHRMDRHPVKGRGKQAPPKGGRGGKYTWEGPRGVLVESEVVDEGNPNHHGENEEEEEEEGVEGVVGEVGGEGGGGGGTGWGREGRG